MSTASTSAAPQQPLPPVYVSIRELSTERHRFNIAPSFQRKQVWTIRMRQAYIDSLLRGDPIPSLEAFEEYNEHGLKSYEFIDGHQRIQATLDFVDGLFKTWTPGVKRGAEPNSAPPVEPGKSFDELSTVARNYILDFHLQINRLRKESDEQIITRFLRVNNHMPLAAAERLNAYKSKAKDVAKRIEEHPIWETYEGERTREQVLQCSYNILALELAAPTGMVDLTSSALLNNLASGKHDSKITDTLTDAILMRLDVVTHVYEGTHFTVRAAIVAMYQSIMFLEQAGYTVQRKDKGKLTKWLAGLMAASKRAAGVPAYNRPMQMLYRKSRQETFWEQYRVPVFALFGIQQQR